MKEWSGDEAMKLIEQIIKDEVDEEKLSDAECTALAAKIISALESEDE